MKQTTMFATAFGNSQTRAHTKPRIDIDVVMCDEKEYIEANGCPVVTRCGRTKIFYGFFFCFRVCAPLARLSLVEPVCTRRASKLTSHIAVCAHTTHLYVCDSRQSAVFFPVVVHDSSRRRRQRRHQQRQPQGVSSIIQCVLYIFDSSERIMPWWNWCCSQCAVGRLHLLLSNKTAVNAAEYLSFVSTSVTLSHTSGKHKAYTLNALPAVWHIHKSIAKKIFNSFSFFVRFGQLALVEQRN